MGGRVPTEPPQMSPRNGSSVHQRAAADTAGRARWKTALHSCAARVLNVSGHV